MNRQLIAIAAGIALCLVIGVAANYVDAFGTARSAKQEVWGQFGDYFGGVLNPVFALLAFLGLLWSISTQERESRAAAKELSEQTELARQELQHSRADRLGEELLQVIRDIDSRLVSLLATDISATASNPRVTIELMVAEAERLASTGGDSHAFRQFVQNARCSGSVVEAPVREIKYLVAKMREFLQQYSRHRSTTFAPLIVYYADKIYRLVPMLEAVGGIPDDTRTFFATVSDAHC
jgi:hypothetical protein